MLELIAIEITSRMIPTISLQHILLLGLAGSYTWA